MLNSIYDLMGQYVDPPIDETSRHLHLEYAIEVAEKSLWN